MPLTPAPGKSAGFAGSVELHQADRPNPLGDLGPALYEPILRQGTGNPRRGVGSMDDELLTKPLGVVLGTRSRIKRTNNCPEK